ncbi:MAG: Rid family hydrolase [Planctomycetota bacterium]
MSDWQRVGTGNRWETAYAYSRASRAGGLVFCTGTVALADGGEAFAPGDAHAQTLRCFEIIEGSLRELGLGRTAIVRSRVFVTDIHQADAVGRAHASFFGVHRPCLTQVGVHALIAPEFVVEIECDAVAGA